MVPGPGADQQTGEGAEQERAEHHVEERDARERERGRNGGEHDRRPLADGFIEQGRGAPARDPNQRQRGERAGQARRELALSAKRRGEHEQAAKLWHELAADESLGIYACVQLAIYYERRAKRLETALEFARLALTKIRRCRTNLLDRGASARNLRLEQTILSRVARLEHRMRMSRVLPALPMGEPSPKAAVGSAGRITS